MSHTDLPPLGIGLQMHPDQPFLDNFEGLLEGADFLEVAPENLWSVDESGKVVFNDYSRFVSNLRRQRELPVVGHGFGLSCGSVPQDARDRERLAEWHELIGRSQELLEFVCFTDHLGFALQRGLFCGVPLPIVHHSATIAATSEAMQRLSDINPFVGFEHIAFPFVLGDPAQQASFLADLLRQTGAWLLLDLHNVYMHCEHYGLEPRQYVEQLPLEQVLIAHIAGGSYSDPDWLASKRSMRLDSHDATIPEEVWRLCEEVLPRCRNLRGIVMERSRLPIDEVEEALQEQRRARTLWQRIAPGLAEHVSARALTAVAAPPDASRVAALQHAVIECLQGGHCYEKLSRWCEETGWERDVLPHVSPDGFRVAALLVQKIRFERLMAAKPCLGGAMGSNPQAFVDLFDAYQEAVPPTAFFPSQEAAAFDGFVASL